MKTHDKIDKQLRQPPEAYLDSTELDHLARMNMELLSELWIARDRIAVLEQVLADKGVIESGAVDTYVPDESMTARLDALRRITVENVIGAPFKNNHTVESLKAQGRALAAATAVGSSKKT